MEIFYTAIKDITIVCILVIVSVHTLVDILDKVGYLPEWIEKKLHGHKEKEILEIISKLGIDQKARWFRSVNQVLEIRSEIAPCDFNPHLRDHLRIIVKDYIEEGRYTIGSNSKIPVKFFVNLRHAFCTSPSCEYDKRLAEIMLAQIRDTFRRDGISAGVVVGRKNGLNLLAYIVARSMGLPLLLYSEDVSIWNPRNGEAATARPRHLDYDLPVGAEAIIVDDSCVGGGSFKDLALDLKRQNIKVEHAFILFCRKEVNACKALLQDGITLHFIDEYNDNDLSEMKYPSYKKRDQ